MPVTKTNRFVSNSTSVESSNTVRRPESKDTKSKKRVLKNTNDKSMSINVRKFSSSGSVVSNKHETINSTVCQSNTNVLKAKTINAVNDGSNIVCVSCDSRVKRALFTSLVAEKSRNLGATSIVAKSRFSVAKTPTTTNKISSASSLSPNSSQSRTLSNYIKIKLQQSESGRNGLNINYVLIGHLRVKPHSQHLVIQLVLWIVDSGCSKHMTGNLQLLRNFVEKLMGIVCFRNDHFAAITGYGDYVHGNLMICNIYYVEGLGHNLFLVRQFCDEDLEVAFRLNTCYVQILEGEDLLTGSCDSNLYTISISELADSYPSVSKEKRKKASFPHKLVPKYYATRILKLSNDSVANTLDNEDTPSSSLIIVEENEAPQVVTSSEEQVANEQTTSVSTKNANEPVQEDIAAFDGNDFYNLRQICTSSTKHIIILINGRRIIHMNK
ncbi:hypothetical protein Tco_0091386 [Tanacetum coccineum]